MKKTMLGFVLALASFASLAAQSVTLEWDQNPETDLDGYVLAYSTTGANWTVVEPVQAPQVTLLVPYPTTQGAFSGLAEGTTYHFAVKARNIYGLESLWSDVVSYTVPRTPPARPAMLRIKTITTP